jgi:hypothetical protein
MSPKRHAGFGSSLDLYETAAVLKEFEGAERRLIIGSDGPAPWPREGVFMTQIAPEPGGPEDALWLGVRNDEARLQVACFIAESRFIAGTVVGDAVVVEGEVETIVVAPTDDAGAGNAR